ncbi:TauA ABC-type nitrate/sulfonate/bicarbonate transport systems, periplasmic components [Acidimicrobiia bacterium]
MSRSIRRRRGVFAAIAVLMMAFALLATGCGSSSSSVVKNPTLEELPATDAVSVRLGYFPNVTHAPALVGLDQGLFTKELGAIGATMDPTSFNAGPEAIEALFAGAIDITYIGPNPAVNAFQKSNGEAVQIIAGSTSGGAAFVVQPSITSAADLKGKTVASPQLGGTQDVALRSWLAEKGLKTDTSGGGDVAIKPQANADTLSTFKSGAIAGAWVPAPWDTRLVTEGGGKVLVDEATLWPNGKFTTTVVLVRTAFLNKHPAAVAAILRGHLAALDSITSNPSAAQASTNNEIEAVTGKRLAESLIVASWKSLLFTPDPLAETIKKSADEAVTLGLNKPINIAPIFNLSLLNALLNAKAQPTVAGL